MEEEKAAAYYEELTRKGEGAARFKQGLGFSSSSNDVVPPSFLNTFVKASATCHKQSQLQSIHNKLSSHKNRDQRHKLRSSSRDRETRSRRKRKSSSSSDSDRERRRSVSPTGKRKLYKRGDVINDRKNVGIDYAKLIHGYHKMSPAERVKAKMKLQLSETAKKDAVNGMGSGWERFEFDKEAPLDDEEMEVADDDVALVKHIGHSFRFSSVEANRDDQIKAAHDEAMFGSSHALPSIHTEHIIIEQENGNKSKESVPARSLLSDKVFAGQQSSWRDRARKA